MAGWVERELRPMHKICRLVGMEWWSGSNRWLAVLIAASLLQLAAILRQTIVTDLSFTDDALEVFINWILMIHIFLWVLVWLVGRKTCKEFLKEMDECGTILGLGRSRRMTYFTALRLILGIGVFVTDMFHKEHPRWSRWTLLDMFLCDSLLCQCSILQAQMSAVISTLGRQFESVIKRARLTPPALPLLFRVYRRLLTMSHTFSNLCSPLFLIVGVNSFINSTICLYYALKPAFTRTILIGETYFTVMSVVWFLLQMLDLVVLVHACDTVKTNAKEFINHLYTVVTDDKLKYNPIHDSIVLCLVMKDEPCFSAKGFFELDFGFLTGMVGAMTTYMVIMLQFVSTSEAEDAKEAAAAAAAAAAAVTETTS